MKKFFIYLFIGATMSLGSYSFPNDQEEDYSGDEGTGGAAFKHCPIWNVTYETTITVLGATKKITCSTGGEWTCN